MKTKKKKNKQKSNHFPLKNNITRLQKTQEKFFSDFHHLSPSQVVYVERFL